MHYLLNKGIIPSAFLQLYGNPVDGNNITIGGHEFRFLTALTAPTSYTQVLIGASASYTRLSLVDAINGVSDPTVVQAITPFNEKVISDIMGTLVRISLAHARGVAPAIVGVAPSIPLTAVLEGGLVWDCANLNVSGASECLLPVACGQVIITAEMLAAGAKFVSLPFTLNKLKALITVIDGTSLVVKTVSDQFGYIGNVFQIGTSATLSPPPGALQLGDIVNFMLTP